MTTSSELENFSDNEAVAAAKAAIPDLQISKDGGWHWDFRCSSSADFEVQFDSAVEALAHFAGTTQSILDAIANESAGGGSDDD